MTYKWTWLVLLLLGCAYSVPTAPETSKATLSQNVQEKDDLTADASTGYARRYSDLAGAYPGGYNSLVTGYGLLDENKYPYNAGINGYDNGYRGYNRGYSGYNGYVGGAGYGGYKGYAGYDPSSSGVSYSGGNGGYGGYGGNGGLTSYYGYNNPYYQSAYHLGYGYYNKKPYGNIYNSGITPSLVTGYRGYSRR